ncbi:branched-chain amino acid ABC transporter permease [Kaistia dalseonensis]|uniref:Branched-chain amino acid transport system permease protein/urea transport system permease protein n=1 Tax=Kaistia dalseonensis TaxID=410840 RepID=A0ABU0H6N0_9HYPH|nr:branched-chain amino acid ABC transporter permease [Kaistia dalseonensis]MCX5494952.1 branched-chain amino acid ABC transporter permease [Kaistia dalseonensis]MDQ0437533.1 branched-chain amino acid transport system permease protein/urea transport system permease protein [Kaistia dalseonensis]
MERLAIVLLDSSNAVLVLMLVSLGLAIIFGLMNVINMAHGEFLMLGCYALLALTEAGLPFFLALALAPFIVAGIGLVAEELLIRRTYARLLDTILATWGLSLFLRQGMVLLYGPGSHAVAVPDVGSVDLFGTPYPVYRLIVMAISIVTIIATFYVFFRTRFGLAARAVIANRTMASCLGIDTRRLDRITFAFGSGLAGLAGAAMAPLISIDPNAGLGWMVPAFLSILVGGLGTISGPLAGAAGVGAVDSLTAAFTSPVWAQLVVFTAAILVIRLFPNGLVSRAKREA